MEKQQHRVTWADHMIQELINAAAQDCRACSHWPPDADTFECRSECQHRGTCEAFHALVQAGHVILVTVHKDKEAMDRALEADAIDAAKHGPGSGGVPHPKCPRCGFTMPCGCSPRRG